MAGTEQCSKCGKTGLDAPGRCKACQADRWNTVKKIASGVGTAVTAVVSVVALVVRKFPRK